MCLEPSERNGHKNEIKKSDCGRNSACNSGSTLPKFVTNNVLNAVEPHSEQAVIFSDGTMAIIPEGAEIARPNSSIVVEDGDFTYVEQKVGTLYITDYNREIENLVFPSEIDGKIVTRICLYDTYYKKHK